MDALTTLCEAKRSEAKHNITLAANKIANTPSANNNRDAI